MKHAISARWLASLNYACSHLSYDFWISYEYLIQYQSDSSRAHYLVIYPPPPPCVNYWTHFKHLVHVFWGGLNGDLWRSCPPMLFKFRPCIQKLCNVYYPPTPSLGWIWQIKGRSLSLASARSASWLAYSLHPRSLTPIWSWMQGWV